MTIETTEIPRGDAGDEAGGVQGTHPAGNTRRLRVVDQVEELRAEVQRLRDWSEVMMTQAAHQRVRADRLEVLLARAADTNQRLRRLSQHLIDRLGSVPPPAAAAKDDDTEPVW